MKNKKIIISALLFAICSAAALTSCGGGNTNGNQTDGTQGERVTTDSNDKENQENTDNIINDVESGLEDIGSDISDSIGNPEDATHGTEDDKENADNNNAANKGETNNMPTDGTRHRGAVPYGK